MVHKIDSNNDNLISLLCTTLPGLTARKWEFKGFSTVTLCRLGNLKRGLISMREYSHWHTKITTHFVGHKTNPFHLIPHITVSPHPSVQVLYLFSKIFGTPQKQPTHPIQHQFSVQNWIEMRHNCELSNNQVQYHFVTV